VIGAIIVAITIFLLCKRRKRKVQEEAIPTPISTPTNTIMSEVSTDTNRFGQFANDFDNHIEPPKSAIVHVEDISPLMQQYQLQLKLLKQQNSSTSSSSNTSSTPSPPPPPYQP
jgi:hypothetical protein